MTVKKSDLRFSPLEFDPDNPLAKEHALIKAWVEEAMGENSRYRYYADVDLQSTPSGKAIWEAKGEDARRLVMAAILQVSHWDNVAARIRAEAETDVQRVNTHLNENWPDVWGRRRQAATVVSALMRRAIPFTVDDLIAIALSAIGDDPNTFIQFPVGAFNKSVERVLSQQTPSDELRSALRRYADRIRSSQDKAVRRSATMIEQLVGTEADTAIPASIVESRPLLKSASGCPTVLIQLKHYLGLLEPNDVPMTELLPDRFQLRADSPLAAEHALLSEILQDSIAISRVNSVELSQLKSGQKVMKQGPAGRGQLLLAAAERRIAAVLFKDQSLDDRPGWQSRYSAISIVGELEKQPFALDRDGFFDFVLYKSTASGSPAKWEWLVDEIKRHSTESPLTDSERYTLSILRASLIKGPMLGTPTSEAQYLTQFIADNAGFYLLPDEHWSAALNEEIHAMTSEQKAKWIAILKHWLTATAARPSAKWLKACSECVKEIGAARVEAKLIDWLSRVPSGRNIRQVPTSNYETRVGGDIIQEENANCLRGMLWTLPAFKKRSDECVRVASVVAQSAYKKIPGVGPRAVKVGNAAIYALSEIGTTKAVGQLAMLKVRVKFGTAQKEIEKAFNAAAEALGLPRDQIEELGVPTYGLEEVGIRRETFGDSTAELSVNGRDVSIHWTSNGKPVKSVPAKVKSEFKEELKELQGAAKDIAAMLPAQSERLDSLFLLDKSWPASIWRERYLDHPLIGTLARRLIWTSGEKSFAWFAGELIDVNDKPVKLPDDAQIKLWHPINRNVDEITSWRAWLQRHEVIQPFKQAHREIYLLTDAERRTETYSNRFASHILRQHQFNALCAARFWKNKLRLMVDDVFPPATRLLSQFGLVAEFWIDGIGDDYGRDTTESGAYLRVSTDQVRFYRAENLDQPLNLEQIPPLVLSEIFRDVDLFVGVASVGNDPTWQDGGPDGRHRTYWQEYSFGILGESAKIRKSVLETLMPRLTKLKGKWELTDKFLIIKGTIRSYKIHLGSGNILMEPNDQYLCIVADRSAKSTGVNEVLLPFEGDAMLSIILSKAFLLADDEAIKDTTITAQIRR